MEDLKLFTLHCTLVKNAYACDITLSRMHAGVMPFGAVSSSGFGDGSYVCYTHEGDTGEIDFAFIVFIDE